MGDLRKPLAADAVRAFLASDGAAWSLADGRLHRDLRFADFPTAFGFMASVATVAERLDHHPDWSNAGRRVAIDLVTRSSGGISELDLALARAVDRLALPLEVPA